MGGAGAGGGCSLSFLGASEGKLNRFFICFINMVRPGQFVLYCFVRQIL